MEKSEKLTNEAIDDLVIYNEDQQFWHNVAENAKSTIQQFKNGIKLNEAIKFMAENKVKELAD